MQVEAPLDDAPSVTASSQSSGVAEDAHEKTPPSSPKQPVKEIMQKMGSHCNINTTNDGSDHQRSSGNSSRTDRSNPLKLMDDLGHLLGVSACVSDRQQQQQQQTSGVGHGGSEALIGLARTIFSCASPSNQNTSSNGNFQQSSQYHQNQQQHSRSHHHHHDEQHSISATSTEEHQRQLRRMTSWNTIGTAGTLGTAYSEISLLEQYQHLDMAPQFDDDGNVINPSHYKAVQHRGGVAVKPKRKRIVKFDYPPISSLRECPRPDPAMLGQLYFTEDELDQIEDDRECTFTADDVEVVAVASSLSQGSASKEAQQQQQQQQPSSSTTNSQSGSGAVESSASAEEKAESTEDPQFTNYVATPSRRKSKKKSTVDDTSTTNTRGRTNQRPKKLRRFPTPAPKRRYQHCKSQTSDDVSSKATASSNDESQQQQNMETPEPPPRKERLIKSVQIYLRERSTGW